MEIKAEIMTKFPVEKGHPTESIKIGITKVPCGFGDIVVKRIFEEFKELEMAFELHGVNHGSLSSTDKSVLPKKQTG